MSFTIESKVKDGIISADIHVPTCNRYRAIRLYLRHPDLLPLKHVRVNGREYHDFDAADGYITLPAGSDEFRVEAEYR